MINIISQAELLEKIKNKKKAYLLLYKKGSEQSDCSFQNLSQALKEHPEANVYVADTTSSGTYILPMILKRHPACWYSRMVIS